MPYSFSAKVLALAEVQTTPPPAGDEAPVAEATRQMSGGLDRWRSLKASHDRSLRHPV